MTDTDKQAARHRHHQPKLDPDCPLCRKQAESVPAYWAVERWYPQWGQWEMVGDHHDSREAGLTALAEEAADDHEDGIAFRLVHVLSKVERIQRGIQRWRPGNSSGRQLVSLESIRRKYHLK